MTSEPTALELRDRCLAVYVDETGHEALDGQPVYGLGGCAVLGRDYERILNGPWRAVRKQIAGSFDAQLHANKFRGKPEDIDVVALFFRKQPFWRFAAVVTQKTILADQLTLLGTMKDALEKRINDIAGCFAKRSGWSLSRLRERIGLSRTRFRASTFPEARNAFSQSAASCRSQYGSRGSKLRIL